MDYLTKIVQFNEMSLRCRDLFKFIAIVRNHSVWRNSFEYTYCWIKNIINTFETVSVFRDRQYQI